jgi:hypothetical protein
VKYLINDLNFFYVLTRSFSSDAVAALLSNIRLRGGSNDLTDCRAAEHAVRLILKNGLMKSVNTSNLKSGLEYTSKAKLIEIQNLTAQPNEIIVVLPDNVIEKLEKLQAFR